MNTVSLLSILVVLAFLVVCGWQAYKAMTSKDDGAS